MKVSLNTIKQLVGLPLPPIDELVDRINQQLGGVEEVIDLGAKYEDAKIVRVVECNKHPNADKLSVCKIDDDSGELITVVCGANNVRTDMWAVWLPTKSTVPSSYNTDEPFVLEARELRGVVSNGMLASARELDLGDDHDGIVEVTVSDLPQGKELSLGASFAEVFGLDDTVIDIENKMFTHRPDLFGQLGVAREISAILQGASDNDIQVDDTSYVNPDWYWSTPEFANGNGSIELDVFNETPDNAPRFMAVAIDDVTVKPSPLWLRCELVRWGSKPINNVVDLTNYIMLLTAQPTHAYDYDKLRGHKLGVRMAHKGEQVTLLNGKTYQLTSSDMVIADGEGAVGLAGIMGGGNSEVSAKTSRVVLEVANFNMYTLRKSSMRHGVFTDALTRFNKGQSPLQNGRVLQRLLELMPGKQASRVFDLPARTDRSDEASVNGEIKLSLDFINQRLGLQLTANQVGSLLRRTNFAVQAIGVDTDQLGVTAPFWRTDIELPEDIVEEVGRLYGFDKLPRELPRRTTRPTALNLVIVAKQAVRDSLSRAGANEVLTYSFIHQRIIEAAGQDANQAYRLTNALSPDLQYYRLSLTPSLLDKVHANIKARHDEFALFEVGKSHNVNYSDDSGLPKQFDRVALVYANRKATNGSAYYKAKRLATQLLTDRQLTNLRFEAMTGVDFAGHQAFIQMSSPFAEQRSAVVYAGDKLVGIVGEYRLSVQSAFKLPQSSSGFELFISPFVDEQPVNYRPLSRYPSSHQDVSLQVDDEISYQQLLSRVEQTLLEKAVDLRTAVEPLSIYQAEASRQKTITFRLTVNNQAATLTDATVSSLVKQIADDSASSLGAKQI